MTVRVRPAAVAGMFYPGRPDVLADEVDRYLAEAARLSRTEPADRPVPKAIIAPHAGYVYSGPVAASVYVRLCAARDRITRVVLLGPAHRTPVRGLAVTSADAFETPLGLVPIDHEGRDRALMLPTVTVHDTAHAAEHSIEVHLPFLQRVLGDFELLPLVVGEAGTRDVEAVLDALWGGPETLVVISTDLSHYHDYGTAKELDATTAASIVARRFDSIGPYDACGAYPLRGLLAAAADRGMSIELVDLRSSGDTAGDRDRVVGYGAFVAG